MATKGASRPPETPFRYDGALLSSCASSPLVTRLLAGRDGGDGAGGAPPSDDAPRRSGAAGDCRALFAVHAAHYRRPPPADGERRFWDAWVDVIPDDAAAEGGRPEMSPRIEAFLRSVAFVHRHNGRAGNHRVALNRFSDVPPGELPLMSHTGGGDDASPFFGAGADADVERLEASLGDLFPLHASEKHLEMFQNRHRRMDSKGGEKPMFVPLEDEDTIMKFGEKIRRTRELRRADRWEDTGNPPADAATAAATRTATTIGSNFQSMVDSWWWIGKPRVARRTRRRPSDPVGPFSTAKGDPFPFDSESARAGLEEDDGKEGDGGDIWDRHLDWATGRNPDGVPVVHDAMDQGLCGSCWAISALGTLEASVARNMAYSAYAHAFSPSSADAWKLAVLVGQAVERRSVRTADLSVQELVDCDTGYDQGCAGGNPLLAFYFLHRYGVTSSKNYPYTATMDACRVERANQPVASVESWGILTPDHENNIEKVLRFIGPVAVGLIGADPGFLMYAGGIFMSTEGGQCDSGQADHAMLITGYGEEVAEDGTVQKYWIARNSWGSGWGENGYIRIARLGGKKGHRGVCGIARSPSVALGGMFTSDVVLEENDLYGSTRFGERVDRGSSGSRHEDESTIARASSQIQSVIHRIRTRLGFVQKGIVMYTNNGSENGDADILIPYALVIGMLAFCLLLAQIMYHKRLRGRRQRRMQREQSIAEESIATNCSTVGVYNGICESLDHVGGSQVSISDGERMHLLANSSGALYT